MFHAIASFLLGLTGTLPMRTPKDLAAYTRCQPDRISHWIGQRITYKKTPDWEPAEACMARGTGDCKCMAVIAEETLNYCAGIDSRIAILRHKDEPGPLHAVTLYTDERGRRGFINDISRMMFDPGTAWDEVLAYIGGGPWLVEAYVYPGEVPGGSMIVASADVPQESWR